MPETSGIFRIIETRDIAMRSADLWTPYVPEDKMPWTLRRVVHLHRRAAFAATWDELQRDLRDGPAASVDRLLAGTANAAPVDFTSTADVLADAAVAGSEINRLKAWWFYRMLFGPDPLTERLTLFWHDHFATVNSKVQDVPLMYRQNDTLRRHARGKFTDLLGASVREPALLLYLDAQANRKSHPNENLARELMELFTLGVGHYSETDVKEAARALTGWTVMDEKFAENAARHDNGEKTILGHTGKWGGSDLVKILLSQPATARRIATKLCRLFFGETAVVPEAVTGLATALFDHELNIGWAVGTILKSRAFFADANLGTRVLSPVEYVVGSARALEMFDPAPSTLALADWSARIGQDLFEPPNVGGWPGGRAWIHTRGLVARANYAAALVDGGNAGRPSPYDLTALPRKYGFGADTDSVLTFHHRLLFGTDPTSEARHRGTEAGGGKAVIILLSSPQALLA
jgi:uncharacterized protein (DUF1800 family)